jgi:hypothetical protein
MHGIDCKAHPVFDRVRLSDQLKLLGVAVSSRGRR